MEKPCILAVIQSDLPLICQLRTAWEDTGLGTLRVTRNTQEAILYLRGVGVYADRASFPLPQLVALDCSNPSPCDLEVLGWLRESPEFFTMPVALLCPSRGGSLDPVFALDPFCYLVDRKRLDELVRTGSNVSHSRFGPREHLWAASYQGR